MLLKDCLRTRSSWLGGFKTSLWRLQWKLDTIPAFGVYPFSLNGELGPVDVSSIKSRWGWCWKPKQSRRQSCCLLADPLLPFLLMDSQISNSSWPGEKWGGGGELYPFLPVLRQDVRVLPTLCSCSPPEHLCIKSLWSILINCLQKKRSFLPLFLVR